MNELEKYKQTMLDKSRENNADDAIEIGMDIGFDAAITLDLPVKFGIFYSEKCSRINNSYHLYQGKSYTIKQLYNHWLDNILKIE